MVMIEY
jgi:hypothetical protein